MTEEATGVGLHGDEPKRLGLSDGTRLVLDTHSCDDGDVSWKRVGWRRNGRNEVSVAEAASLAGGYGEYVRVRTRAEAAWLENVANWYAEQAARLRSQLEAAPA